MLSSLRQAIAEIVCIQNLYNVAQRGDDEFIGDLAAQGICLRALLPAEGSRRSSRQRLTRHRHPRKRLSIP